jgi:HEAT repeat protein
VFAGLLANAQAQSRALPSTWIDISDAAPSFENLVAASRRAAVSDDIRWIGYFFPLREGVHIGCDDRRGRSISFGAGDISFQLDDDAPRSRSCDEDFGLFLRFDDDDRILADARMMSLRRAASRLDETVVWAGEMNADASVAWLRSAVLDSVDGDLRAAGDEALRTRRRLLSALAVHDSAGAISVILATLDIQYPAKLRESAVFWAAQLGGDTGLLQLIDLTRHDADAEVRKQAIFWLAQVAGERATQHLAEIAAGDPDTSVRQSAVFALSQSEDGGAIDALIDIVRTHENREVVKAALFWLGQSGDARAVALIEELLFRGGR